MALYAFDGTWNENKPGDEKDTNVFKFQAGYQGRKLYIPGVGTKYWWIGKLFGGIFGAGGKGRVKKAYKQLLNNFQFGDRDVDIIGFSRGSALALDFANKIASEGVPGHGTPKIRFVGVWDIVASFGIPGNDINWGYELSVPDIVEKSYHAMALDERRRTFVPTRLKTNVQRASDDGRVFELWFRGVHSDIGGGNKNLGLSSITLQWMLKKAKSQALPLSDDVISNQEMLMKPDAAIGENTDPIENRCRTVRWNDAVHVSVNPRPDRNNPPPGIDVVDDNGQILPGGFNQ